MQTLTFIIKYVLVQSLTSLLVEATAASIADPIKTDSFSAVRITGRPDK